MIQLIEDPLTQRWFAMGWILGMVWGAVFHWAWCWRQRLELRTLRAAIAKASGEGA